MKIFAFFSLFFFWNVFACNSYTLTIGGKKRFFDDKNCIGSGAQGSIYQHPVAPQRVIKIFHGEGNSPSTIDCENEFKDIEFLKKNTRIPIVQTEKKFRDERICYLIKDKLTLTLESECNDLKLKKITSWESFTNLIQAINQFNKNQVAKKQKTFLRDWGETNIMLDLTSNSWVLIDFSLTSKYQEPQTKEHFYYYFGGTCFDRFPEFKILHEQIR
jgi:PhoP regulatory network protein YrbL